MNLKNRMLSMEIAHEINKLQQQILEALHIKTKKPKMNRINLKIATMFLNAFSFLCFF